MRSAFAVASLESANAMQADVSFRNITPEDGVDGMMGVDLRIGRMESDGGVPPSGSVRTSARTEASSETLPVGGEHAGVSIVAGGDAALMLEPCRDDTEWRLRTGVEYGELAEPERIAVVESIRLQLNDREVDFGPLASGAAQGSPAEIADAMTFTVIEPQTLEPSTWDMPIRADAGSPEGGAPPNPAVTTAHGYSAWVNCNVAFEPLRTALPWGLRLELPALVAATAKEDGSLAAEASLVRRLLRLRETPHYGQAIVTGLDAASTSESWAGVYGTYEAASSVSDDAHTTAGVGPVGLSYTSRDFQWSRDARLFLAGVAVSLAASMLMAIGKLLVDRSFDRRSEKPLPKVRG
ncbi:hypothetical protein [Actinotalea sp. JY-7876]|uniref:hypothetical protein n=1 Tax=Actinotalea sp. JY-7876 TaxID=2758442 RepID=UPI0015F5A4B2|nr:hypothetical protein [Actinotalea sp. JY-7876]